MTRPRTWTEYGVFDSDGEVWFSSRDLEDAAYHCGPGNTLHKRSVTQTVTEWGQVTCPYVTSLDRECGREATNGEHCALHSVLAKLESDFQRWNQNPVIYLRSPL